jgi:hypothetical protein
VASELRLGSLTGDAMQHTMPANPSEKKRDTFVDFAAFARMFD